jgi:alpha,alpha-trehalase
MYVAVTGLSAYHHEADAKRLAMSYLAMVGRELIRRGAIFEKYDGERQSAALVDLKNGYTSNEEGFGWTNGVVLALWRGLSPMDQAAVLTRIAAR